MPVNTASSPSSPRRALILWGGWEGHHPQRMAELLAEDLDAAGFTMELVNSLDPLAEKERLLGFDLIVPCWTMGELADEQSKGLQEAVRAGVGLGGLHGGMGDAFRGNLDYEWMVGGHFLGHPHVGDYVVCRTSIEHPITAAFPAQLAYKSEQYYMAMDPMVSVLVDAEYHFEGQVCRMPVVWIKTWGSGRVFYSALGHDPQELLDYPAVRQMTLQGLLWAAR